MPGLLLVPTCRTGLETQAQEATPQASLMVLRAEAEVAGLGLAERSALSWQWFFSLPAAINPYFDAGGDLCGHGQAGPVFILAGAEQSVVRSCLIPARTRS